LLAHFCGSFIVRSTFTADMAVRGSKSLMAYRDNAENVRLEKEVQGQESGIHCLHQVVRSFASVLGNTSSVYV
jgi:hypothetical protein